MVCVRGEERGKTECHVIAHTHTHTRGKDVWGLIILAV